MYTFIIGRIGSVDWRVVGRLALGSIPATAITIFALSLLGPWSPAISAFITSTITGVGLTEMQVVMTSTNPGKVGEQLVFTVTVTNLQDDDARDVFALLAVPKKATFVSVTKGCTKSALVACKLGQKALDPDRKDDAHHVLDADEWNEAQGSRDGDSHAADSRRLSCSGLAAAHWNSRHRTGCRRH